MTTRKQTTHSLHVFWASGVAVALMASDDDLFGSGPFPRPLFSRRGLEAPSAFSPWRDPEKTQIQALSCWSGAELPAAESPPARKKLLLRDEAPAADFSDLGPDITAVIALSAWLIDRHAPLHAVVCQTWARAAPIAKNELRCLEVAPPRTEVKGSITPAIDPTNVDPALAVTISEWLFPSGTGYSPFAVRTTSKRAKIEASDMIALLDEKGWLTNFISDSYLSTLMPELTESLPPDTARAFLPGFYSTCMIQRSCLIDYGNVKFVDAAKRVSEIFINYNHGNYHWALMRLQRSWKRLEIFDGKGIVKKAQGRHVLNCIGLALQVYFARARARARAAPCGITHVFFAQTCSSRVPFCCRRTWAIGKWWRMARRPARPSKRTPTRVACSHV